ncbi:hypothetical protein X953_19260 [Virgibacillus sp. SK37]|nr:hypothetical protein X953_19260 [Virgibacillus sp. SK37]
MKFYINEKAAPDLPQFIANRRRQTMNCWLTNVRIETGFHKKMDK